VVIAGGMISAAPPASAGCQYGGIAISRCDGPVQPDGTWQRCMEYDESSGLTFHQRIHRFREHPHAPGAVQGADGTWRLLYLCWVLI